MNRSTYCSDDISGENPGWYWTRGLHDAHIVSVEHLQLQYDNTEKNPIRNSLKIFLDSSQALYDNSIQCITLYNYKIMTSDVELNNCYWLQDILTFDNGKYILNITVTNCKTHYVFTVKFDKAIVE